MLNPVLFCHMKKIKINVLLKKTFFIRVSEILSSCGNVDYSGKEKRVTGREKRERIPGEKKNTNANLNFFLHETIASTATGVLA